MSQLNINTNVAGIAAYNSTKAVGRQNATAAMRLSSGLKINSAADDAAGMAVSEKMRAQIIGLERAERNIQDGISLFQTTDGALQGLSDLSIRMRELAIQAINDTNTDEDRQKMTEELGQILAHMDNIAKNTEFNHIQVLYGDKITVENAYKSNHTLVEPNIVSILKNATINATSSQSFTVGPPASNSAGSVTFGFSVGQYIDQIDPNFINFLKNDLYNADGSISQKNGDHLVNVLVQAIDRGFQAQGINSSAVGVFGSDGYMYLGLKDGSQMDMGGCTGATADGIGHAFLHTMFTAGNNTADFQIYDDKELFIQMGANSGQGELFTWNTVSVDQMGLTNASLMPRSEAEATLGMCDYSMQYINTIRGDIGAYTNRLEYAMQTVQVAAEKLSASMSRIRDADMAKEMMAYTKTQVVSNAGLTMIMHANEAPQTVVSLLRQ